MEPAFYEGDRVVTFNWDVPIVGGVVVVKWRGKYQLKRVKSVTGGKFLIAGDNNKLSSKAKEVLQEEIIGRVFLKY